MKMFQCIKDVKRCKDANGDYCRPGEYSHPALGIVYFAQEIKPTRLLENSSWIVKIPCRAAEDDEKLVMREGIFYKIDAQKCRRVRDCSLAEFTENQEKTIERHAEPSRQIRIREPAETETRVMVG